MNTKSLVESDVAYHNLVYVADEGLDGTDMSGCGSWGGVPFSTISKILTSHAGYWPSTDELRSAFGNTLTQDQLDAAAETFRDQFDGSLMTRVDVRWDEEDEEGCGLEMFKHGDGPVTREQVSTALAGYDSAMRGQAICVSANELSRLVAELNRNDGHKVDYA